MTSIILKNSVGVHNPNPPSDLLLMTGSLQLLEELTRIRLSSGCTHPTAFEGQPTNPPAAGKRRYYVSSRFTHPVSEKTNSYTRVEWLKQIIGGKEPKWWVSDYIDTQSGQVVSFWVDMCFGLCREFKAFGI